VATKQVNIDILAKDKTRQAMQSATKGVDKLKNAVFNLRNAFLGLGAGLVAKSFLDTAKEIENLRVRFRYLFADAQEGEKAFKGLVKFAGDVPFALDEIQRGAGNLAVVSKNAKEMNELLAITGDIATVTGLDFQTTAEQLQRVFSGGIASADLFREKGVRDMLEFQAGVQYSAEQSREHILRAFRDGTTNVKGASSEMATTFTGTMSMIGDKFLQFKMAVMDSAPFDFIKAGARLIEKDIAKNFGSIEKFAEKMGKALVDGFRNFLLMGAKVYDTFQPVFSFLGKSVENLVNYVKGLPAPLDTIGVIGFLMLGTKGKALVFLIGGVLDDIRSAIGYTIDAMATVQEKLNSFTFGRSKKSIENAKLSIYQLRLTAEELKTPLSEVEEKLRETGITALNNFVPVNSLFDDTIKKTGTMTEKLETWLKTLDKSIEKEKELKKVGGLDVSKLSGSEMGIKGVDIEAIFGGINFDDRLSQTTEFMNNEIAIHQEMFEKQYQLRQDQDELLAELDRIRAEDKIALAYETAQKEMAIRKKAFDDNFNLIKSGKAGEINLEKLTNKDKVDLAKKVGLEALDQLAQTNKKAFMLNKAYKIAEAISNTAMGITEALKLGPIVGPPLALAIGALGAVQVATIASTKFQGKRLGGRMNQDQPYMVGEAGPELVVPDKPSNVVPNGQLGGMGKQVNVNFHITTVDATGFSELLVNSRATIVNVINQALNEKGKEVLV